MTATSYSRLIASSSVVAVAIGVWAVSVPAVSALPLAAIFVAYAYRHFRYVPLVILVLCSAVGLPAAFQIGPASGLGFLTIAYAGVILLMLIASKPSSLPLPPIALPYVAFLAWAFTSTIANMRLNIEAIQNLLVLSIPALLIALICSDYRESPIAAATVQKAWIAASLLSIVFFVIHDYTIFERIVSEPAARSFALFALFCVAWHSAAWRYGSILSGYVCLLLVLGIGVSLSRTALIVAILLIALSRFDPKQARGWISIICWLLIGSGIVYWAVTRIDPLRERFLEGDTSLQVGGIAINAMGRTWMWETTLDSYAQAPWVGQGSASVQELMQSLSSNISHPHNDYLRILHDFGNIGMALWTIGMAALLVKSVGTWLRADQPEDAAVHLAATLSIVGLCLSMLTDNPIVYVYCMVPLGITLGTSLARQRATSGSLGAARLVDSRGADSVPHQDSRISNLR